tara:strand:+ start:314 stop:694 length:381 start_codon:yes stop_codon:yes gene_type:complete
MTHLKKNKILIFFFIFGLLQIYYLYSKRSNFNFEILRNPFKKDSHINLVLEKPVIESKQIIQSFNLKKFNLSQKLKDKDSYFYQRLIEYNYPVRMDPKEEYTFFLLEEKNTCKDIFKAKFIKLKKC